MASVVVISSLLNFRLWKKLCFTRAKSWRTEKDFCIKLQESFSLTKRKELGIVYKGRICILNLREKE